MNYLNFFIDLVLPLQALNHHNMKTLTESDAAFVCDIQAPCFQTLSRDEMELVQASKTQVLFRKGETLAKQGAFASYVLFIIDGLAKQYIEGDATHNFNLSLFHTGQFVGLSAVFNRNTYNYSATAVRETKAYLIENKAIENLMRQNGLFAFSLTKRYCEQDAILFDTIHNLMYKQMNGRLADTLLYLSSEILRGEEVFSSLARKDIAEFAGISTESAVKLLKTFEKDGLIELHEKDIRIINRNTLLEISRRG